MLNLHYKDTPNIGDKMCTPSLYYPYIESMDIRESISKSYTCIIYGGGAIANPAIRHAFAQRVPTIFWGGGSTQRGSKTHKVPHYNVFDLCGTRDYGQGEWLPCVSCKHPAFDIEYEPRRKVVYYGHKKVAPLQGSPYMDNEHPNMWEVVAFLGSAEKVVTSSYHGMYWARLLGKNVEVFGFGSKFYYCPVSLDLGQCRQLNDEFYDKVVDLCM